MENELKYFNQTHAHCHLQVSESETKPVLGLRIRSCCLFAVLYFGTLYRSSFPLSKVALQSASPLKGLARPVCVCQRERQQKQDP